MTDEELVKLWDETNYFIDIAGLSRKLLIFYTGGYAIKQIFALKPKARLPVEQRVVRFHNAMEAFLSEGRFPWQAEEHVEGLTGWLFVEIDKFNNIK